MRDYVRDPQPFDPAPYGRCKFHDEPLDRNGRCPRAERWDTSGYDPLAHVTIPGDHLVDLEYVDGVWRQAATRCPVFRRDDGIAELCQLPAGHHIDHAFIAMVADDRPVQPRRVHPGETYRIGSGQSVLESTGMERAVMSVTLDQQPGALSPGEQIRRDHADAFIHGEQPAEPDAVNHPSHYGGDTVYEVIKVCEAWSLDADAYLFQAVKYIARAGKKTGEDAATDLAKARFYIDRRIALLEGKVFHMTEGAD